MLRTSRENGKIMLEVILEAWSDKNMFFLYEKHKISVESKKINHKLIDSLTIATAGDIRGTH